MVKLTKFALMVSISSVLYVLEGLIPFPVPGGKWGLSNFLVLQLSYYNNVKSALLLASMKSIVGGLISGSFFTPGFFMGFFGALTAAVAQRIVSLTRIFGILGVSLVGMISNNLVQFLVGSLLIKSRAIFSLLPIVMLLGSMSAIVNAYLAQRTVSFFGEGEYYDAETK